MSAPPRRTVVVAVSAASIPVLGVASFEIAAVSIRDAFGVSTLTVQIAFTVPAATSMLLVFVAGLLVRRVDALRMVRWSALVSVGSLIIVAVAPSLAILSAGRAFGAISAGMLAVAGLGILQQVFPEAKSRARVFGLLASVAPAITLTTPTIAGILIDRISWRAVPVVLAIVLAALASLTLRLPPVVHHPKDDESHVRAEWVTPLLAGVGLAALVGAVIAIPVSVPVSFLLGGTFLVVTTVTVALWRRATSPGLDVTALRQPAMAAIIAATALTSIVNFAFFAAVWLQSQPGADVTTTALALAIPQLVGIAGGIAGGRLAAKFGPYPVAITAICLSVLGGFAYLTMTSNTSAWFVIASVALVLAMMTAAAGPLTQIFFERVPAGMEGSAAAWRTVTRTVATAAGGILVVMFVTTVYRSSVAGALEQQGISADTAAAVAADLQGRVPVGTITDRFQLPDNVIADMSSENPVLRQLARSDAMGAAGIFTISTNALAAVALVIAYRRRSRSPGLQVPRPQD